MRLTHHEKNVIQTLRRLRYTEGENVRIETGKILVEGPPAPFVRSENIAGDWDGTY